MKLRNIFITAIVITVIPLIVLGAVNFNKIRWDKFPIIGTLFLEIELSPSGFDASYLSNPITWKDLYNEPADWEKNGKGPWFWFNNYTKNLLQNYMKNNNLGIVPNNWQNFKFRSNFEDCLDTFEFISLGKSSNIQNITKLINTICYCTLFLSSGIWILTLIVFKKQTK